MDCEIIVTCSNCQTKTSNQVWLRDLLIWRNGAKIQDCFHYLTPGQRESMLSGLCEPCFDKRFGNEEC